MRVVTDSISSYYNLKEANDRYQAILENKTAPMIAYSHMQGKYIRTEFLQAAYKELLKNHPHDNICGCSTDQVHKDMQYRYAQVKEFTNAIRRDFVCRIRKDRAGKEENYLLEIFNPAPYNREQMVTVDLEFDRDFVYRRSGNTSHQLRNMFRLFNANQEEIEYQILDIERNLMNDDENITQEKRRVDRYTIAFYAALNAFGMTEYLVVPSQTFVRNRNSMKSGDSWAENKYAKLEIQLDGTLTLTDKVTGKIYEKLHYFLDDAEAGNGWFHEDAGNHNAVVSSRFAPCTVEKVQSGSQMITFRVTKFLNIPECMDYENYNRSSRRVDMKLVSDITLKQDSGKVYIETKVDNCAKDHRLKLMIPTNINGDTYCASEAFYFAERPVGVNPDTFHWFEMDPQEKHFDGIIYKRDHAGTGLAFVGQCGFHQAGVLADDDSTISVVMLRSFGRVFLASETNECQIQGEHTFRYTIIPMNKDTDRCDLINSKKYDFEKEQVVFTRCSENMKAELKEDMLQVLGDGVAVSIVKPAEEDVNRIILRVFNTKPDATAVKIMSKYMAEQICTTDFYENVTQISGEHLKQVELELKPFEIKTIALKYMGLRSQL